MESPSLFDIYLQYPTSIYSICHTSYPHDVDKYVENLGITMKFLGITCGKDGINIGILGAEHF